MHEMTLAAAILGVVLEVAEGEQVYEVSLQAGALRRIVTDNLQFCFDIAAEGTPAEGAALVVDEIPARVRCDACRVEAELTIPPFVCFRCGTSDVELLSGTELFVDGVELESGWMHRVGALSSPLMEPTTDGDERMNQAQAESLG